MRAPCLTYVGREGFDFSIPSLEEQAYEHLLRNLHGKPQYRRPPLGQPPSFVTDDDQGHVVTSSRSRQLRNALERGVSNSVGILRDYLDGVHGAFADQRIDTSVAQEAEHFDELVMKSIEAWEPYRNEWIEVVRCLVRYGAINDAVDDIHSLLERLRAELGRPEHVSSWKGMWDDNLSFILRELFTLTCTELVAAGEVSALSVLLGRPYFFRGEYGDDKYQNFVCFNRHQSSLDQTRNQRRELRRVSVTADTMKARCDRHGPPFDSMIDLELLLFVRSVLESYAEGAPDEMQGIWSPQTVIYRDHSLTWGLAKRLQSRRVFDEFAPALGVTSIEDLRERFEALPDTDVTLYAIGFTSLSAQSLRGLLDSKQLGRIP